MEGEIKCMAYYGFEMKQLVKLDLYRWTYPNKNPQQIQKNTSVLMLIVIKRNVHNNEIKFHDGH